MSLTEDQIKWHVRRMQNLKADRANFDSMNQEIAELVYPTHANFVYTPSKGEKRMQKVFDSTAIHANELLSSGLFSLLTSTASKWFELRPADLNLYKLKAIKEYLDICTRIMFHEINRPSAGFATAMHECYLTYCAFGNLINYVTEIVEKRSLLFQSLPFYECYFVENQYGIVDTLYRKYNRTVEFLARKFGKEKLSPKTQEFLEADKKKLDKVIECTHIILPRPVANIVSPRANDKPFASFYIENKENHLIHEGGYDELPFMAARFYKESFETYGRGPGATALPDIKMLMRIKQVTIRAAQKTTDPAIMLPDAGFLRPFRTTPGGINYYRKGRISLKNDIDIIPTGNPAFGETYAGEIQNQIRQIFFVDQLQLHEGPQMTATEVMQRTEEKLRLMGPLLGRIQTELLGPLIQRVFGLLYRAGKLPDPPPELQGQMLKIVYTSPIARAQEQVEANGLMRAFSVLEPLIKMDERILDNFNTDEMTAGVFDMFSVNPKFLRTKREVDSIRTERAKAEKQKQEAEALRAAGQGADALMRGAATAKESGIDTSKFGMLQ